MPENAPEKDDNDVFDLNEENIPVIMQQLLDKEELQNKALQEMFGIQVKGSYMYKDVIKCMGALFFRQKYAGVIKSAFDIWLNTAVMQQQQQQEESKSNKSGRSAHSAEPIHDMIEGDIVELRKPEFAKSKK